VVFTLDLITKLGAQRLSGTDFYRNMSTLCYFIQKSSISVYQYLYFIYFHNALKHWNIPNK